MEYLKQQKVLHKKYLLIILKRVREILMKLPTLVDYNYNE